MPLMDDTAQQQFDCCLGLAVKWNRTYGKLRHFLNFEHFSYLLSMSYRFARRFRDQGEVMDSLSGSLTAGSGNSCTTIPVCSSRLIFAIWSNHSVG